MHPEVKNFSDLSQGVGTISIENTPPVFNYIDTNIFVEWSQVYWCIYGHSKMKDIHSLHFYSLVHNYITFLFVKGM